MQTGTELIFRFSGKEALVTTVTVGRFSLVSYSSLQQEFSRAVVKFLLVLFKRKKQTPKMIMWKRKLWVWILIETQVWIENPKFAHSHCLVCTWSNGFPRKNWERNLFPLILQFLSLALWNADFHDAILEAMLFMCLLLNNVWIS